MVKTSKLKLIGQGDHPVQFKNTKEMLRDEISNILFETGKISFENTHFPSGSYKDEMDILCLMKKIPQLQRVATAREKRSG